MGLRQFLDNARRDASSMLHGAIPGAAMIAGSARQDLDTLLFEKGLGMQPRRTKTGGSFQLDDIARMGYQGFTRDSPLVPLLQLNPKEAASRFYDRPISGTLDFLGAGSLAGQGLKSASRIPGSLGESALRMRGFQQLDPTSLGAARTIGEMPARIKLIDGTQVPSREFLMHPNIQLRGDNVWARKSMRSPKSSGNPVFDAAVDTAQTLGGDPLALQAVPRAGTQLFAKAGDLMEFGPKIGSKRFGKRLALRNRSRLRVSTQEMMGAFGAARKQWRKQFGPDADEHVGDALFLASSGIKSWDDFVEAMDRFNTSGRKAIFDGKQVDLNATAGDAFDLNKAELDLAERFVAQRDTMASNLAARIGKLNERGHQVILTGGPKEIVLTPELVLKNKNDLYRAVGKGNLHIRQGTRKSYKFDETGQGQLFATAPVRAVADDVPAEASATTMRDQTRLFDDSLPEFPKRDVEVIDGESFYRNADGELIRVKDADRGADEILSKLNEQDRELVNRFALHEQMSEAIRPAVEDMQSLRNQIDDIEDVVLEPHDYDLMDNIKDALDGGIPFDEVYDMLVEEGVPGDRLERIMKKMREDDAPTVQLEDIVPEETQLFDDGGVPPGGTPDVTEDIPEPDAASLKELRAKTAEDYSQATWYKNYLDNLVAARLDKNSNDIVQKMSKLFTNEKVKQILESEEFQKNILPSHKAMVAAQLEADKVRLGANALSNANVVRNSERLSMLTGKEGGLFFVARPKHTKAKKVDRNPGDREIEVIDEGLPGDPAELIARGDLDTNPQVHMNNYLRRKREAANQELVDTVADSAVVVSPQQQKAYTKEGIAVSEENFLKPGGRKSQFVIVRPNGSLFKKIEEAQPLAHQTARRLQEDGFHSEAANIREAAKEMFEATSDGEFSLGDMIRNPKLRGEMDDTRYMVPADMYEAIVREVSDSTNALSSFLQATSTGFKISVLHGRWPGWVVNNTIGAQLYLALTGGFGATIPKAGGTALVKDIFPDVLGVGSREMAAGADDLGRVAQSRVDRVLDSKPGRIGQDIVNTLSDWNQKIADEPARANRISQVVEERFQATVELAKARGIEIPDTLEARRKMLMDQTVREDIAQEVLDDMIDFTSMSRNERMWVSNVIPFWTFIKGSTKSTGRLIADHPGRTWLPMEVGSLGSEMTDEVYPMGTPEYLRSLIPMGQDRALSIGGWNPYGQQGQMLGGILSMLNSERPTGQDHPASMINPALTIPLEAITNRDIYTDYPLTGNIAQNLYEQTAQNVPFAEFLKQMAIGKEVTGREVFPFSRQNAMLNFAGVPVRDVNRANLNVRMRTDENRRHNTGVQDYWRFHDGV